MAQTEEYITHIASCKKMNIALHRVKDGTATPEPSQKAAVSVVLFVTDILAVE